MTKVFLFLLSVFLPLSSLSAAERQNWCEYRLLKGGDQAAFLLYFQSLLDIPVENRPASLDADAAPGALAAFGISGEPGPFWIELRRNFIRHSEFILKLKGEQKEVLYEASINVPPVYVWEKNGGESAEKFHFPSGESGWSRIGMGVILDNSGVGRRVFELQRSRTGKIMLVLELDVECDRAADYTRSRVPRQIHFLRGYSLCRIPVIRAPLRD